MGYFYVKFAVSYLSIKILRISVLGKVLIYSSKVVNVRYVYDAKIVFFIVASFYFSFKA